MSIPYPRTLTKVSYTKTLKGLTVSKFPVWSQKKRNSLEKYSALYSCRKSEPFSDPALDSPLI